MTYSHAEAVARLKQRSLSEKDFQQRIIDTAQLFGWLVHHCRPAWDGKNYRTPIAGDTGFPDLVLVHPTRLIVFVAELKSDRGRVVPQQNRWLDGFNNAGVRAVVWRPRDWPAILAELEGERAA